MAVLISPSNNTGWGLGVKSMYGGSKFRSAAHPVLVHQHYRAKWGAIKHPRVNNTIDEVIESVISNPLPKRRRRKVRRLLPRADITFLTRTRRKRGPRIRRTRRL